MTLVNYKITKAVNKAIEKRSALFGNESPAVLDRLEHLLDEPEFVKWINNWPEVASEAKK